MSTEPLLKKAIAAASLAGVKIRAFDRSAHLNIQTKGDQSPVTAADMAAHLAINEHLKDTHIPIISEESIDSLTEVKNLSRFWLIDPLDGTKGYIAGSDEYTVNVALIEDGKPTLGVIYAPSLDEMHWGSLNLKNWGAKRGQQSLKHQGAVEGKIRLVLAQSLKSRERIDALIQSFPLIEIRFMRSSLKLCRLALGDFDVYVRHTPSSSWDTAAGQAILEARQGHLLDRTGNDLSYSDPRIINPTRIYGLTEKFSYEDAHRIGIILFD